MKRTTQNKFATAALAVGTSLATLVAGCSPRLPQPVEVKVFDTSQKRAIYAPFTIIDGKKEFHRLSYFNSPRVKEALLTQAIVHNIRCVDAHSEFKDQLAVVKKDAIAAIAVNIGDVLVRISEHGLEIGINGKGKTVDVATGLRKVERYLADDPKLNGDERFVNYCKYGHDDRGSTSHFFPFAGVEKVSLAQAERIHAKLKGKGTGKVSESVVIRGSDKYNIERRIKQGAPGTLRDALSTSKTIETRSLPAGSLHLEVGGLYQALGIKDLEHGYNGTAVGGEVGVAWQPTGRDTYFGMNLGFLRGTGKNTLPINKPGSDGVSIVGQDARSLNKDKFTVLGRIGTYFGNKVRFGISALAGLGYNTTTRCSTTSAHWEDHGNKVEGSVHTDRKVCKDTTSIEAVVGADLTLNYKGLCVSTGARATSSGDIIPTIRAGYCPRVKTN